MALLFQMVLSVTNARVRRALGHHGLDQLGAGCVAHEDGQLGFHRRKTRPFLKRLSLQSIDLPSKKGAKKQPETPVGRRATKSYNPFGWSLPCRWCGRFAESCQHPRGGSLLWNGVNSLLRAADTPEVGHYHVMVGGRSVEAFQQGWPGSIGGVAGLVQGFSPAVRGTVQQRRRKKSVTS